MITIKRLELKRSYRIEWLRYITGVDLNEHCMKSLLGHNDTHFKSYRRSYYDLRLLPGYAYYYFCAVDENWIWANNIHLAFREKTGYTIMGDTPFMKVEIENAEVIPITDKHIDWNLPQSKNKLFNTCRNWQFANMIKGNFVEQKSLFNG